MRLSLTAAIATLALMLPGGATTPAHAVTPSAVSKPSGHKHYKLYVKKGSKHYRHVHTFRTDKEAHKIAHKYHKRGYKTKIRAV